MTPEVAHALGKQAADQLLTEAMGPVFDGTIEGIMRDLERAAEDHAPSDDRGRFTALFLRGAASHFSEIVNEVNARAAALEAS